LIAALNPIFITESASTLTEPNFLFFQLLAIYFLIKGLAENRKRDYLIYGALIGFTSLIRPVAILFPFAILLFLLIFRCFKIKLLLSLVALAVVLSPWIIRNYLVFDKFIPLTNLSGIVFYQGNNQYVFNSKSGSWISQDILFEIEKIEIMAKTEIEVKELSMALGKNFLKKMSIMELLKLEWYKLRYGFGLSIKCLAGKNEILHYSMKDKVVYFPLLLFSLIYASVLIKRQKEHLQYLKNKIFIAIFLSAFSVYLFQTLVFFGYPRYRAYLFVPYLIMTASVGIFILLQQFSRRSNAKKRESFT
jgi:4-amino-4-deoxy-L-arabinose transferase-like glycosyltransferase